MGRPPKVRTGVVTAPQWTFRVQLAPRRKQSQQGGAGRAWSLPSDPQLQRARGWEEWEQTLPRRLCQECGGDLVRMGLGEGEAAEGGCDSVTF